MGQEKLTKVDSVDSDVEKGTVVDDVAVAADKGASATHRPSRKQLDLDTGEEHVRFRRHWYQLWSVPATDC